MLTSPEDKSLILPSSIFTLSLHSSSISIATAFSEDMSIVQKITIISALSLSVFPFIVGDVLKCFFSSFIAVKLNKILKC